MTAFNINSGGVETWHSKSGGSTNATLDSYAISAGSTLLIKTDSYQCANHSAAFGSLDTVTFSGIGGTLKIDPTAVRVIPFNTGSGTVPAIGTTIQQGALNSGSLLGVWADWQSEPLAAAATMPTSGYIKILDKTGNFSAGALTGISASATGADVQGWIEVRGADTATITVPRLGKFEVVGAWFELGTTNGTAGQVIPCPTTATVAGVFPGVWIETASGSGVYERFVGVGSMVNTGTTPTDLRGKVFWQTTSGIRLGSDGTTTCGFLPPTGCKVRIPAAILTCCTRTSGNGSGPRVLPNATLATRQEFVTTAAGDISINGAVFQWYGNFLQAYRTVIKNSALSDSMILQEVVAAIDVDNVIVGPTQAQLNFALNMLSCIGGGTVKNALFARFSLAASGAYVNQVNYNKGIAFDAVKTQTLLNRGNATTGTWTCTQNVDCTWNEVTDIGGRALHIGDQRSVKTGQHYADVFTGTTGTTLAQNPTEIGGGSVDFKFSGLDFGGLTNVQGYAGAVGVEASYRTRIRNIGTFAAPLDLGSVNPSAVFIASTGNNDDLKVQRCYCINTRNDIFSLKNTDINVVLENFAADYADNTNIPALNATVRAVGYAANNAGKAGCYGTHWLDFFNGTTTGRVTLVCNEPTTETASVVTITSGTPKFNSAGQIAMTTVGDQIIAEMPYFAKGHTALADAASAKSGTNTGNLDYEFQYDLGSGYNGTWLTMSQANLAAVSSIDPAVGIRLKYRITCNTSNSGNLLTQVRVDTVTSSTAQSTNLYPLDLVPVSLTNIVAGSRLLIKRTDTSEVVYNAIVAGTSFTENMPLIDVPIYIELRKASASPYYQPWVTTGTVTDEGFTATALQVRDDQ